MKAIKDIALFEGRTANYQNIKKTSVSANAKINFDAASGEDANWLGSNTVEKKPKLKSIYTWPKECITFEIRFHYKIVFSNNQFIIIVI